MMSVAPRHRQQQQHSAAASADADYDHHERHAHHLNAASTAACAAAPSLPEYTQPEFRAGYDVMTSPSWRIHEGEAVLQPANFDSIHGASPTRSACFASPTVQTSVAASATATKPAIRVSLITSRSLYNIHEPETSPQPDEDEEEYNNTYKDEHRRRSSALGLDIYGHAHTDETASYEYTPTGRNSISPVSGVPSLSYSSQTSSAGHSTGCHTPTARLSFLLTDAADPYKSTAPIGKASSRRDQGKLHQDQGKEKRLGKAFLGKLKSFLLAPQSPSSAKKDIKQSRTRLRRRKDQPAPVIEARSTSLYRTVDVPDPLVSPTGAIGSDRRASAFCGGPYGNLAAYGHYSQTYASAFESTASFASPPARPQHGFGYASVADFRHYSTAELPLDPTVPYSPYANAEQENRRFSTLFDIAAAQSATEQIGHHLQIEEPASAASSGDLRLSTDKVKLKQRRGSTDWVGKSKQFWSSALDLVSHFILACSIIPFCMVRFTLLLFFFSLDRKSTGGQAVTWYSQCQQTSEPRRGIAGRRKGKHGE